MGPYDEAVVSRMVSRVDVNTVVRRSHSWLLSNQPLPSWQAGTTVGHFWAPLDNSVAPASLNSAQGDAGATGLVTSRDGSAVLHGDMLGVGSLYYWRSDQAVYFSNRLAPALRSCRRPTLDPIAWAALLSIRYVPPGRSPVSEVRTLRHGELIRYDYTKSVVESSIDPPTFEPVQNASTDELMHALGEVIAGPNPSNLLLSGGHDSRLLLAAALKRGASLACTTTSKDDGTDHDTSLASRVSETARIPLQVVTAGSGSWVQQFKESASRMDYATSHHIWAAAMANHSRALGRRAILGMGGGILLNSHMQNRDEDQSGSKDSTRLALFRRLGIRSLKQTGLVAVDVSEAREQLESDFLETTAGYGERPDWQAISILITRTARSISTLGTRLIGPDAPILMPYLAPSVIRTCLSQRFHARRGDTLLRELVSFASADLGRLPVSTDLAQPHNPDPILRHSPATIQQIFLAIAADDVAMAVLHPTLRKQILNADLHEMASIVRRTHYENVLHGALLLSTFRNAFPDVSGTVAGS